MYGEQYGQYAQQTVALADQIWTTDAILPKL